MDNKDNVLPMPAPLERLAECIKSDLRRREYGIGETVDATRNLAVHMYAARQQFPDNTGFGQWCSTSGFGDNVVSKDDRAALVAMGEYPDLALQVLETTKHESLRRINREEFQLLLLSKQANGELNDHLRNPAKTAEIKPAEEIPAEPLKRKAGRPKKDAPPKEKKPHRGRDNVKTKEAIQAYKELKAEGVEPTSKAIRARTDTKRAVVDHVVSVARQFEADAPPPPIDATTLGRTAQERLEAAIRATNKRLELAFEERVQTEVRRRIEELVIPRYNETKLKHDAVIAAHKGALTIEEFNKLLKIAHPDRRKAVTDSELSDVLQMLQKKKLVLVAEKEVPTQSSKAAPLPKTVDELREWKRRADAQRAAARAAKKGNKLGERK